MAMTDFDFMLTEEQIELRNLFRDFAQKEVKEPCRESEKLGECPEYLVKKAIEIGVPMMTLPEEYGGLGLDYLTCAIIREELARGDVGFASRVTGFGFTPFRLAGTEEQRHMAAEAMTAGGVIAFALTESGAGSNAVDMATTARKDGDGYIINGGKTFITNGDCADIVVTFAVTDKSKGSKGITAFMIPKGTPGFDAGHHEDKMGFRNVHTCSLFFDDMRLPDKYRLGEEGEGFSIAMRILNVSRPANSANCVGLAQAALDEAVAYSKQRVVGGQPICKKGVIAAMLADMEMQVQSARQMVWAVCRAANAGIFDKKLTAVAKCFCSDAAMKVTTDAVQIFGGNGYSKEYPVEKLMRDAKIFQIFEGTNQIQRDIIGRQLVK